MSRSEASCLPFAAGAPRAWTIPPGASFLTVLAETLIDALPPQRLEQVIIYVPNRRSARALAFELYRAAGAPAAFFPPDIRTLGDLDSVEAPGSAETARIDVPAPIGEAERLGTLISLVRRFHDSRGLDLPAASALAAARDLARLLDQAALAGGVDWNALPGLVTEADLAGHWQESVEFLAIITEAWPQILAERGLSDAMARRLAVAEDLAAAWRATPPPGPLLIAGSTGATPASRVLMQAALACPEGAVVFPGLDTSAAADDWAAMAGAPSHPQSALAGALDGLGFLPSDVKIWPGARETPENAARRRLVHEALSPADQTGDLDRRLKSLAPDGDAAATTLAGCAGLTVIEAADEAEEAELAALLLRETLETDGRAAALVTQDAGLARHVSTLLKRWNLDVPPSQGTPLLRTPQGSFLAHLLAWWRASEDPIAMAALLQHELIAIGPAEPFLRWALRGPVWWQDLPDLARRLATRLGARERDRPPESEIEAAAGLAANLCDVLMRVGAAERRTGDAWTEALTALGDALGTGDKLWSGPGGAAAARWLDEAASLATASGTLSLPDFADLALAQAETITVPPPGDGHPRLAIWGPLEARLQSADRLILAGLNEEVWPAQPPPEAFLPRHFRRKLGLPEPEERVGLAAHDFAQLACKPDVTLIHAARRGDAPAVASRWIWRLTTLVRGALGETAAAALDPPPEADPRNWVTALRTPPRREPPDAAMPRPAPPLAARPDRLSVTRIEWLQRDPYAIYASQVLCLAPLDPIARPLDARETGTAVHKALERFETECSEDGVDALAALIEMELAEAGESAAGLAARRAVTRDTARWYLDWRASRLPEIADILPERDGRLDLDLPGGSFRLTAKADRIEQRQDGTLAIIDFKTGQPPTDDQVAAGLAPQMPLQALIAAAGAFDGVPAADVSELAYVAFKARPDWRIIGCSKALEATPAELATGAEKGLARLIAAFRRPEARYLSAPRVQFIRHDYGYNRLARRDEWSGVFGDE